MCTIMDASHTENVSIEGSKMLSDKWVLWAHLPHDTDWSLSSYKNIMEIGTVEGMIALYKVLPEKMVKNCMLFLMRKGVIPMWEDKKNRNGGCFSYKIPNKNVFKVWKMASFSLVGETLSIDGLADVPLWRPSPRVGNSRIPLRIRMSGGCILTTSADPG